MSKQIYPPEGHLPPIWGLSLGEFTGSNGVPMIQLTVGDSYICGTVDQMAALVNELQAVHIALGLSGKRWDESRDGRGALIMLLGGTVPE